MEKILIIKLGAMGDVLRTTPLLRILDGDIYWVTDTRCIPLLPSGSGILKKVIDTSEAEEALRGATFDLVLSLDDDRQAARIATLAHKKKLIGSFLDVAGSLRYTDEAAEWFDMGLVSKFTREKADILKMENTRTYQEIIFGMLNRQFKGEEYLLNINRIITKDDRGSVLVGIESRADRRWPSKIWNRYTQLGDLLRKHGFAVKFFEQRKTTEDYIKDIGECDLVVTADTLAMHIALALKIKTVTIFICTSPAEIYGYDRMAKVISPLLQKAFYSRRCVQDAVDAVSQESVFEAIKMLLRIPQTCPTYL